MESKILAIRKIVKLFVMLIPLVFYSCGYETKNREELESVFKKNFGFKPPESIKEIKLKDWGMRDTKVQWLAFTYDSTLLNKIIIHDRLRKIAENGSAEFLDIIEDLKKDVHHPNWLIPPNSNTDHIYFKKDFSNHTFSRYYLWNDKQTEMTFLYVEYFD